MGRRLVTSVLISALSVIVSAAYAQAPNVAAGAQAAASTTVNLNSPPLYADGSSYHACNIANVTVPYSSPKTAITFNVQIIDQNGNILKSANNIVLPANNIYELSNDSGGYGGFARCQISVKGSATNVRANVSVFHFMGSYYETLALAEAR